MLQIDSQIKIPEKELQETFIRASGPGGQNVNIVATAVQLLFKLYDSKHLTPVVKERLKQIAGRRITSEGDLVIEARRFRSQERNRTDARDRLTIIIQRALRKPKIRRKTKPSFASRKRRMEAKKKVSQKKKERRAHRAGLEYWVNLFFYSQRLKPRIITQGIHICILPGPVN